MIIVVIVYIHCIVIVFIHDNNNYYKSAVKSLANSLIQLYPEQKPEIVIYNNK